MRRQLPVYSPLSLHAIGSASRAAALGGAREIAAFEEELDDRFSPERVVLTASGTQALRLAFEALAGHGDRPRVALPGYSCYDLVSAAVGADIRVRFYDVDPVTLTPDLASLRAVVAKGVDAVLAANLYGYPLDWGPLASLCSEWGVPVIEDAAQGLGSETSAGPTGTLGHATILSFGRGKGWTGGGGGALLIRDERFHSARALPPASVGPGRQLGITGTGIATWLLGRPWLYRLPTTVPGLGLGETRYKEPTEPEQIPAVCAALARKTADAANRAIPLRRETARHLFETLGGRAALRACRPVGGVERAAFLRLPVVAGLAHQARALSREGRSRGIEAGYPTPLHQLGPARHVMLDDSVTLAGSEELAAQLVTLPTHAWVTEEDLHALGRLVESQVAGYDGK